VSKALLSSIVSAANHVDYDVRNAATTALTSAFRVLSNRIVLWDTFRKREVRNTEGNLNYFTRSAHTTGHT
jgi:hypothetical protein